MHLGQGFTFLAALKTSLKTDLENSKSSGEKREKTFYGVKVELNFSSSFSSEILFASHQQDNCHSNPC